MLSRETGKGKENSRTRARQCCHISVRRVEEPSQAHQTKLPRKPEVLVSGTMDVVGAMKCRPSKLSKDRSQVEQWNSG